MGAFIAIIVIGIYIIGFSQDKDRRIKATKESYESAKKRNLLCYDDYRWKCQRDVVTHSPVYQYSGHDKNGDRYYYIVSTLPIGKNKRQILYGARYVDCRLWDKKVVDDKLLQYESVNNNI